MSKGIKKGIVLIFIANCINLLLSLVRNFLLPKYLPIGTYADIKTYQLYTSYAGFFALGYIDGMYLKYGGKDVGQIDFADFRESLSTFRILELIICGVLACIGVIRQDMIFVTMSISILFLNVIDFYKCFFQAVGEFSLYSRILNISSILIFAANMFFLFAVKESHTTPYIWSYTIIYFGMWIFVECFFSRKTNTAFYCTSFSLAQIRENISTGFILMLGLFISNFMTGVDRWFVKFTMDTATFARYSFAASILGFLSYAVSPVSVTLYNYFCNHKEYTQRAFTKGVICVFAAMIVACAFPVKFILEVYLTEYYASVTILFVLFASQIFFTIIKCFYVNIYKSEMMQSVFLKQMVMVLIAGIVLNAVLFAFFKNELAYAFGTLLSALIWFCMCTKDMDQHFDIQSLGYALISAIVFVMCGTIFKSYIGFAVYVLCVVILSYVTKKDEMKYLATSVVSMLKTKGKFKSQ